MKGVHWLYFGEHTCWASRVNPKPLTIEGVTQQTRPTSCDNPSLFGHRPSVNNAQHSALFDFSWSWNLLAPVCFHFLYMWLRVACGVFGGWMATGRGRMVIWRSSVLFLLCPLGVAQDWVPAAWFDYEAMMAHNASLDLSALCHIQQPRGTVAAPLDSSADPAAWSDWESANEHLALAVTPLLLLPLPIATSNSTATPLPLPYYTLTVTTDFIILLQISITTTSSRWEVSMLCMICGLWLELLPVCHAVFWCYGVVSVPFYDLSSWNLC